MRWTMEVNTWNCYCASKMIFFFLWTEMMMLICFEVIFQICFRINWSLAGTPGGTVLLPSFSYRVINGIFHVSPPSQKCQVHLQGGCGSSQVTIPLFSGISFVKSWVPTLKYLNSRESVSISLFWWWPQPAGAAGGSLHLGKGKLPSWFHGWGTVFRESSPGIFLLFLHILFSILCCCSQFYCPINNF